jgi:hypothetical protein
LRHDYDIAFPYLLGCGYHGWQIVFWSDVVGDSDWQYPDQYSGY